MKSLITVVLDWESRLWKFSGHLPGLILKTVRATALVIRGLVSERPVMRAAALTYTTTLTMIPTLAMVFGVLEFLKVADKYQGGIAAHLGSFMTPDAALEMQTVIQDSVSKVNGGGLAGMSLLLVLAGAMTLIANIEQAFNHIWGISKMRPMKARVINYIAMLVMGPVALLVPITMLSAQNMGFLDHIPLIGAFIQSTIAAFLPLMVVCCFLFLMYIAIPNIHVRWTAALAGAMVAGAFFAGNQLIAVFLVSKFNTFNAIYGKLATIPIFLVGLFIAWMIILLGAQIAYAWQNVESFRRHYLLENQSPGLDEVVALQLMLRMAKQFSKNQTCLDYEAAGEEWQMPSAFLRQVLDRLKDAGLTYRLDGQGTGYVPARELDQISVSDILAAIRFGKDPEQSIRAPQINQAVAEIYREASLSGAAIAQKSLKALLSDKAKS